MQDRDVTADEATVELKVPYGHQEVRMWAKFAELSLSGKCDPFWPRIALMTQSVLDAIMASITQGGGGKVPVQQDLGDKY